MLPRPTLIRAGIALVGVAAMTGAALTAPATAGAAGSSSQVYYKAVPTCAAPKHGQMGCFAMRRVRVSASTPGAVRAAVEPSTITYGPNGGFTPADLAKAYGQNPDASVKQTVAIVDAYNDPNAFADLDTFDKQYGLPAETTTSFQQVGQDGTAASIPANDTTGWSTEESLDLDAVRGMCHQCNIILVEAASPSYANLSAAVDAAVKLGANEISNSYGGADPGTSQYAAAYNHPGTVITASSADNGYFDWDYANYNYGSKAPTGAQTVSSNAPSFPASDNSVVAVGGTTLQLNDNGTRSAESVWNENGTFDNTGYYGQSPQGASGGGCSSEFTANKWQSSVSTYAAAGCNGGRLVADVSALADPYTGYDIYDSYSYASGVPTGWQTYGGTSLSSPLIAAMWALAGGSGGVTYPSLSLYGHYKSSKGSTYDVTAGGNGYCDGTSAGECGAPFGGSPNTVGWGILDCAWQGTTSTPAVGTRACDAGTGYDGPSGVGTPNGSTVFKAMGPSAVITAPSSITHGMSATFSASKSSDPFPGGSITKYRWTFGDHTPSSSLESPSHTFAKKGTYTVTLTVTDSYSRSTTTTSVVTVK